LLDAEQEPLQPRFYNLLMRNYEESPSRMMDDPHELGNPTKAITWTSGTLRMEVATKIESSSLVLSLGLRISH
jgi:hypothetical protein